MQLTAYEQLLEWDLVFLNFALESSIYEYTNMIYVCTRKTKNRQAINIPWVPGRKMKAENEIIICKK